MNKNKNLGFTLAEVLIVIGIIGVVAALTLPNLNHATGDKEKVTKVKKIYSALTEAIDRAQAIYGPFDTWFNDLKDSEGYIDDSATASERFAKRVTEFMKVSKDCGFDEGCFSSDSLKTLGSTGNSIVDYEDNYLETLQGSYMVTTSDGMSLAFSPNLDRIRVDIDGPNKGRNLYGEDLFNFIIDRNTNQLKYSYSYTTDSDKKIFNVAGGNLTEWVIENGNLDYLKCPEELNWETKTSCE